MTLGTFYGIGVGPGDPELITLKGKHILEDVKNVFVSKARRKSESIALSIAEKYIPRDASVQEILLKIADLIGDREVVSSGMRKEKERAQFAVERAIGGQTVALVSSGDAGVYGMAGLALEIIHVQRVVLDVEIVPGVTASSVAAARLGAPLSVSARPSAPTKSVPC